jgi:hypothetical protein
VGLVQDLEVLEQPHFLALVLLVNLLVEEVEGHGLY